LCNVFILRHTDFDTKVTILFDVPKYGGIVLVLFQKIVRHIPSL
jgi:hypothetical protein